MTENTMETEKTAHVICCNDSVEAVVLDDEDRANAILADLAEQHYERHGRNRSTGVPQSFKEYKAVHYWHLHSVSVL